MLLLVQTGTQKRQDDSGLRRVAEGWSGGGAEQRKSEGAFRAPEGIKAFNNLLQRLGKAERRSSCVVAFTV